MADVENAAAPSAVEPVATPTFDIPRDAAGYAKWRETGEVSQPKSAEAESAGTAKEQTSEPEKAKTAPDTESGISQEHKTTTKGKVTADIRLQEILEDLREAGLSPAQLKALKGKAKETAPAESSTAKPEPAKQENAQPNNYGEWKEKFDPAKWLEKFAEENPGKSYEQGIFAMNEFVDEVRTGFHQRDQQMSEARKAFESKMDDVSKRYPDAKDKITATGQALFEVHQQSPIVVELVNQSPVFHDLLYVLGKDPEKLAEFLETAKTNPLRAVREVSVLENLIMQELDGAKQTEAPKRGEDGKFQAAKVVPEKKVPNAPPPATEVNTRGSAPSDELQAAFDKGDFRAFKAIEDRRDIARRKGQ
jgi:dsDNA-binding SOS-regulon protein